MVISRGTILAMAEVGRVSPSVSCAWFVVSMGNISSGSLVKILQNVIATPGFSRTGAKTQLADTESTK